MSSMSEHASLSRSVDLPVMQTWGRVVRSARGPELYHQSDGTATQDISISLKSVMRTSGLRKSR
jgi:hypothetical protein